jgi:hypothetical protein
VHGWAIDSYGLRAASRHAVLDQLQGTARLRVSPLTWFPPDQLQHGATESLSISQRQSEPARRLAIVDPDMVDSDVSHRPYGSANFHTRIAELHRRGVLVVDNDHECDPQQLAELEGSWMQAGLVGRPTNETIAAVMTADRLGLTLITEDSDVRKLANHWHVNPIAVPEFLSSLAA